MIHGPRRAARIGALVSLLTVALTVGYAAPATPQTPITIQRDLIYAVNEGGAMALDVYYPTEGWGHPSILAIHGGSWRRGDKSDWGWVAKKLARGGFAVFVVNYRLAPASTYPTPVEDLKSAWAWMKQNAARYHGDAQNMGVVGSSAGAHLGLVLASEMSGDPEGPKAVVGLSPPTDLATMGTEGPIRWAVKEHIGCPYNSCPEMYEVASPINRVQSTDPPTFLSYGSDELIPLSHGEALRDRLNEAGVVNRFVVVEGTEHALRIASDVLPKAMRFLRHTMP